MKKNKPYLLPLNILRGYPEYVKVKFAYRAMDEKDYESLRVLVDVMENPLIIFNKALDKLDVMALELLINKARDKEESRIKLTILIIESFNGDDEEDDDGYDFTGEMDSFEQTQCKFKVVKLFLDFLDKENINIEMLKFFAMLATKEEFEDLIQQKKIDLTQDKFSGLDISVYKLEPLKSVLFKECSISDYILNKPCIKGILGLLLSRTYSDTLSVKEISNIYRKLYDLSPISKEIITYTAALISKGNTIKIRFDKDIDTYHNPLNNFISIDTKFMKESIFTIESVVIHEMGHYIYEQLFKSNSRPFSFENLKNFLEQHKSDINNNYMESSWMYQTFYNGTAMEELKGVLNEVFEYEQVARKPIEMAAKLLQMDQKEFDKYIDSNDLAEYFKDHSYIDLFYLNYSAAGINQRDFYKNCSSYNIDVLDNIYNIYLLEHNLCPDNPFLPEITTEEILKWALEEFLVKLVKELNLSPTQVHFLERIGDYVNRGNHLLSKTGSIDDSDERHTELTVRATELRASRVEPEIIESFKGLEEIHIKTASPKICKFIHDSDVASLSFDGEIGSLYNCLENS